MGKRIVLALADMDAGRFEEVRALSGAKTDGELIGRAMSIFDAALSADLDMTEEGDKSDEVLIERKLIHTLHSYSFKPARIVESVPDLPEPGLEPAKAPLPPNLGEDYPAEKIRGYMGVAPAPPPAPKLPVLGKITLSTGRKVNVVLQYPPPEGLTEKEKKELQTARVVFGAVKKGKVKR